MAIVKGTWRFNEWLSPPPADIEQPTEFACKAVVAEVGTLDCVCTGISVQYSEGNVYGTPTLRYIINSTTPDVGLPAGFSTAVYWSEDGAWNTEYGGDILRTITFIGTTELSNEFYEWFTANAVEVIPKTLKGTWRFHETISLPEVEISQALEFKGHALSKYTNEETDFYCKEIVVNHQLVTYDVTRLDPEITLVPGIELPCDVVMYCADDLYGFVGWNHLYFDDGIRTITFTEEQEVSDEFYEWFTTNAVEQKEISGKWRFREVLTPPADAFRETVSFLSGGASFNAMYAKTIADTTGFGLEYSNITASGGEIVSVYADGEYGDLFAVSGWVDSGYRTVDFGTEPRTVSAEFYNWLTANATQPTAFIHYNGSTIASLFGGQTATLKCAGMQMEDDVVVEVAELPEIPEPEIPKPVMQTLEVNITEPGIFEFMPDAGYDGIIKVIVGVDAPQLTAPNIGINGDILTMEATDENTENFAIFVDGIEVATVVNEGV